MGGNFGGVVFCTATMFHRMCRLMIVTMGVLSSVLMHVHMTAFGMILMRLVVHHMTAVLEV